MRVSTVALAKEDTLRRVAPDEALREATAIEPWGSTGGRESIAVPSI